MALGGDAERFSPADRRAFREILLGALLGLESLPLLLSVAVVATLLGVFLVFGGRPFGLVFHTPAIVGGIGMLILLGKLWSISLTSYRRRVTAVMLERRHCPSCGHGLDGCENADGTHARCAECGSVWRLDRVGRARNTRVAPAVIRSGLFDEPDR